MAPKLSPEAEAILNDAGRASASSKPASSGSSVWGSIKDSGLNIGSNILKTLSVPQAAVFTAAAKASGSPISWRSALGDYYTSKSGKSGTANALDALGIKNKWAQLGTEIVADPLWFVAPVKIARGAEAAADVAKTVGAEPEAAKAVRAILGGDSPSVATRQYVKMGKSGTDSAANLGADIVDPNEWKAAREIVRKAQSGRRGTALPASLKTGDVASGAKVGDNLFVVRLNATNKARYRKYGVYVLGDGGKWSPTDARFAQTFTHQEDAIKFARDVAAKNATRGAELSGASVPAEAGIARAVLSGARTPAKVAKAAEEAPKAFKLGPLTDERGLTNLDTAAQVRQAVKDNTISRLTDKTDLGIKLGAGKASKTFNTGIALPAKSLAQVSAGKKLLHAFVKDPVEKVAHRLTDSGRELQSIVDKQMGRVRDEWHALGKDDTDAMLTYVVAAADNASLQVEGAPNVGKAVREYLGSVGKWDERNDDLANYFRERWQEMGRLEGRGRDEALGPYAPQGPTAESLKAMRADQAATPGHLRADVASIINPVSKRKVASPFAYQTRGQFAAGLKQRGLADNIAETLSNILDEGTRITDAQFGQKLGKEFGFAKEARKDGLVPELDFFEVAARREKAHTRAAVNYQIEKLVDESGIAQELGQRVAADVLTRLKTSPNTAGLPGSIGSTAVGPLLQKFVGKYKSLLTTVNLGPHYLNNAFGDFWNSLINGNFRHLASTATFGVAGKAGGTARGGSKWFKLASGDEKTLKQTFHLPFGDFTGQEVVMLSHMAGLGRGFVGADVNEFVKLAQETRNPLTKFVRFAGRQNMTREDAQRLQTWFKHMQAGDNPFVAQAKTLRVHFDYGDLTDFEKVWMRNALMFYTWMKKNMGLQLSGVVTRPGLYGAAGALERNREQFPNEPDYFSQQLPIPTPFGNLLTQNPAADLFKLDAGHPFDAFRRNIIGSVNPLVKSPIELAMNREAFTGADIEKYSGQKVPSILGYIPGLGTETTAKAGGQTAPGVSPWLAYLARQLGPQVGLANYAVQPDSETNRALDILSRALGAPKFQQNQPEKFARNKKYADAKKKGDATRAKNAQGGS